MQRQAWPFLLSVGLIAVGCDAATPSPSGPPATKTAPADAKPEPPTPPREPATPTPPTEPTPAPPPEPTTTPPTEPTPLPEPTPVVDSVKDLGTAYGFNWFRASGGCKPMDERKLAELHAAKKPCTRNDGPPFGESEPEFTALPSFTCPVDARTEWLVFASEPACVDQYEVMQANGP